MEKIKILQIVATTVEKENICRGQVGFVKAILLNLYQVEFKDKNGKVFAEGAYWEEELLVLQFDKLGID
jgi:hypothetical protein